MPTHPFWGWTPFSGVGQGPIFDVGRFQIWNQTTMIHRWLKDTYITYENKLSSNKGPCSFMGMWCYALWLSGNMIVKPSGHGTFHKSHNSKTFRTCWILAHTLPLLDVSPCVKWLVNRNYLHPQHSYNMLQWYQALKWIKMVLWSTFAGYVENSLAVWRKDEKDEMAQWYPQLIQNSWYQFTVAGPPEYQGVPWECHDACGCASWKNRGGDLSVSIRCASESHPATKLKNREIKSRWTRSMARCLVMQCCLAKIQRRLTCRVSS